MPPGLLLVVFFNQAFQLSLLLKANHTLYLCGSRGERGVQPTFAILPRCVPGQAEERREENNRSGHSSISEPHLISAMPPLG